MPAKEKEQVVKYDYIQNRLADRRLRTHFALDKELKITPMEIEPQGESPINLTQPEMKLKQ